MYEPTCKGSGKLGKHAPYWNTREGELNSNGIKIFQIKLQEKMSQIWGGKDHPDIRKHRKTNRKDQRIKHCVML